MFWPEKIKLTKYQRIFYYYKGWVELTPLPNEIQNVILDYIMSMYHYDNLQTVLKPLDPNRYIFDYTCKCLHFFIYDSSDNVPTLLDRIEERFEADFEFIYSTNIYSKLLFERYLFMQVLFYAAKETRNIELIKVNSIENIITIWFTNGEKKRIKKQNIWR